MPYRQSLSRCHILERSLTFLIAWWEQGIFTKVLFKIRNELKIFVLIGLLLPRSCKHCIRNLNMKQIAVVTDVTECFNIGVF